MSGLGFGPGGRFLRLFPIDANHSAEKIAMSVRTTAEEGILGVLCDKAHSPFHIRICYILPESEPDPKAQAHHSAAPSHTVRLTHGVPLVEDNHSLGVILRRNIAPRRADPRAMIDSDLFNETVRRLVWIARRHDMFSIPPTTLDALSRYI